MGLDSSPDSITGSTSFYVQKLFSTNRGKTILPVESSAGFGPVYWVASVSDSTYYVKLANYGSSTETVTINIEGTTSGTLQMVSGDERATNYPHNAPVQVQTSSVEGDGSFKVTMPAWGVAVLAVS